ncbi:Mitogen-activated protein kinase kinase kinase 2 [Apostasia shenzhenica]|uniref:Mitogen-activated protein kinase kinase kinase 2 n=1 Tax=Apostasia shenzhenica TaxID=1088818 RepID=A0A2H9ZT99_9ASPA|nr:Mitogen-activated protein kinase kinase kinase 2 [Apostasia shenzhenica]
MGNFIGRSAKKAKSVSSAKTVKKGSGGSAKEASSRSPSEPMMRDSGGSAKKASSLSPSETMTKDDGGSLKKASSVSPSETMKYGGRPAEKVSSTLSAEMKKKETPKMMHPSSSVETTKEDDGGSENKAYSVSPDDYRLLEEIGQGASATVYRAMYVPSSEIVAIKCVDLDRCNSNLDDIRREAQTMSLLDHPNVVKAYCSFVVECSLWVVMPFMAEGSCLHLMKFAYPNGFEEHVIGPILKETLKALEYLHSHGHIHRDVKAGNILLDSSGVVKLADFGVTAYMFDQGDRQRSRNTFVGTPCWMAPEVMQPGGGYDFKADMWSFGITALELAHGHAPFSKYPPMKVLLLTLQNAPPGLDYDRDKKFSKAFKEMVAMCLVKDQTKRPTVEKLLKHPFFKNVKPPELSVKCLLEDLPSHQDRVKALQLKDAEQLALKKMPSSEQEALSQSEYQRGVSAWNFDIEDLKLQASLIQEEEDIVEIKEDNGNLLHVAENKDTSTSRSTMEIPLSTDGIKQNAEVVYRRAAERSRRDTQKHPSLSGPLMLSNRSSTNSFSAPVSGDSLADKSRANLVQIKGRFSVTAENVDLHKD